MIAVNVLLIIVKIALMLICALKLKLKKKFFLNNFLTFFLKCHNNYYLLAAKNGCVENC